MLKKAVKAYQYLVIFGGLLKSPILLIARLYFGWVFFQAGLNKFHDINHFAQILESYHLSPTIPQAYIAALIELVGGICLMVGFATRLAVIPLIIVMITAYSTVHIEAVKSIFSDPSTFIAQAPFNPLLISLILLAFGPGRISLDYFLEKWLFRKHK